MSNILWTTKKKSNTLSTAVGDRNTLLPKEKSVESQKNELKIFNPLPNVKHWAETESHRDSPTTLTSSNNPRSSSSLSKTSESMAKSNRS